MNLHALAIGPISAVNPQVPAELQLNQGTVTQPDGTRQPLYSPSLPVMAQVQALTFTDLHQIDGLNLAGARRAIYLYGSAQSVIRLTQQGGDLIVFPGALPDFPAGSVWLINQVLEQWPGWCKVAATLQVVP